MARTRDSAEAKSLDLSRQLRKRAEAENHTDGMSGIDKRSNQTVRTVDRSTTPCLVGMSAAHALLEITKHIHSVLVSVELRARYRSRKRLVAFLAFMEAHRQAALLKPSVRTRADSVGQVEDQSLQATAPGTRHRSRVRFRS